MPLTRLFDDHGHCAGDLAATGGKPVGVTGFCMGGMYALFAGCGLSGVAAVAPFYGLLSHEHGILFSEDGLDHTGTYEVTLVCLFGPCGGAGARPATR